MQKVFEITRDGVTYLLWEPEEGGYVASVPGLPGCLSQGDNLDEAFANIEDAFDWYVECSRELGLPPPAQFEHASARAS